MITREITAKTPDDHNIDEIRSIPLTITEEIIAQKLNQNTSTSFETQTQSTSVTLDANISNIGTTESTSPTEVKGVSNSTSCALIPGNTIQLPVPTITIRNKSDIYNEANTSAKCSSQKNPSAVTARQFHI